MAFPDHLLFAILAVLGPLWAATFGYRRLRRATPAMLPRVRRSVYRGAIVVQWTLTLALVAGWAWSGRSWTSLGVVPRPTWGLAGVLFGTLIVVAVIVRQRIHAMRDPESLAEVRERMRHVAPMIPRTPREMRWFYGLSVTAGICEELLYRGFMIFYLVHFTGLIAAAAIAAAIFGIGHVYQGTRGVLLTAAVGAFLAAVYFVSGSLWPGIAIHALMDMHSGHLAYVAFAREDEWRSPDSAETLGDEAFEVTEADGAWEPERDEPPADAELGRP